MNAVAADALLTSQIRAGHSARAFIAALAGFAACGAWALDGSTRESRIDMTWMASRPSALGLSLGMNNPDGRGLAPIGQRTDGPSVDLGLRLRHTLDSNYRVDVVAWRRMAPPDALTQVQNRQASYGARVEMPLSPVSRTGLVADRGFVGIQLESGARLALRRSHGGPMMYYRSRF